MRIFSYITMILFWCSFAVAQVETPPQKGTDEEPKFGNASLVKGPQLFFDAKTTGVSRDGKKQMFSGQVVAIGAGILITADKVEVDRSRNLMVCEGHVIILTKNQVFIGEKIEYQLESGNFKFTDAVMISNDNKEADSLAKKILGFTPEEVWFESKRKEQLSKVETAKEDLRIEFREMDKNTPTDEIVLGYARLLEKTDLIKGQENPALAKMAERRREIFKNRRKYWESKSVVTPNRKKEAFFRLEGRVLERVDDTVFLAQEAIWSPCNCDDDEEPAWGFRADSIEARSGGYVDLYHPVLEIKGVPILYLPYLKLPIKSQRQSGFLMPRFADDRESGTIYSQPVYFLLSDKSDATLTTELYENRGTKLGLELRHQSKQYSGFEFEIERMRDRLWLDNRAIRKDIIDACEGLPDDQCDNKKRNNILGYLASPSNTWRGQKKWSGLQILAPRLSFVTNGSVLSDHRYIEDLTLPDDFKDTFELGHNATYFSTSSGRFHLDGKDFYLGAGSDFGDNVRTNRSFDGYQVPARLKMQSRLFSLIPKNGLGLSAYGQISLNHIQIMDFNDEEKSVIGTNQKLGSGFWERAKFDYLSPLVSESVVGVDHFADFEFRRIRHEGFEGSDSHIHSWRTGITFNLPLDGESELADWLQDSESESDRRHLHHLMNWAVTFSVRPVVARRGPYYTEQIATDGSTINPLYYFYSDTDVYNVNNNDAAAEEDMMKIHQRVQFSTSHRWRSFLRGWKSLAGKDKSDDEGETGNLSDEGYAAKAKRELMFALDRPVEGADDMFGEIQDDYVWYINRYRLEDYGSSEHMTFAANIAYDFEKEKIRNRQKKEPDFEDMTDAEKEQTLVDPWSELYTRMTINAVGLALSNINNYNTYTNKFTDMAFTLGLPRFWGSVVSLGYTISQDPNAKGEYLETRERSVNYTTNYRSHLGFGATLAERVREGVKPEYHSILRVSYTSFEDCWKIDLGRTKKFEKDERDAVYLLQLSVLFLGEERRVGNLGDQVRRYLDSEEES